MRRTVTTAARASATVWSDVVSNPDLRRLEIGRVWSVTAESIAAVGLAVYGFTTSGAIAVAALVTVQYLPGALAAPWLSGTADRFRRERVLVLAELGRALTMAITALLAYNHAPIPAIAALAALLSIPSAAFYPARRSLVPLLVRSPRELTSANVASSTLQSAGLMVGPVVSGIVLATHSGAAWPVFAISAGAFLLSSGGLLRIHNTSSVWLPVSGGGGPSGRNAFRTVRHDPHLRAVMVAFTVKNLARGAFTVLVVTIPLEMLHLGSPAVGYLSAAIGAGGMTAGFLGGAALLHGRRLGRLMVGGLMLWAIAMLAIAAIPATATAVVGLAVVGLGNAVVDVAGYTMVTRNAADDVLARVYGLHESTRAIAISAGALMTAAGVELAGTRATLVIGGCTVTCAGLSLRGRLRSVDRASRVPDERLELLRASRLFGRLQPVALERVAARMRPVTISAGDPVVREGEVGQAVYLIAEGTLRVTANGHVAADLTTGDHFGEIALLDASPRTATVVASTAARLLVLDGEDFLSAVGGHPVGSVVARSTADARLRELAELGTGTPGL